MRHNQARHPFAQQGAVRRTVATMSTADATPPFLDRQVRLQEIQVPVSLSRPDLGDELDGNHLPTGMDPAREVPTLADIDAWPRKRQGRDLRWRALHEHTSTRPRGPISGRPIHTGQRRPRLPSALAPTRRAGTIEKLARAMPEPLEPFCRPCPVRHKESRFSQNGTGRA